MFSLAAALAVVATLRGVGLQRFLGVMSLAAAAVLLIIGDIHGGAATIGATLGAILAPGVVSSQSSPETSRSDRQQSRNV